jgi:hypothetical protein
MDPSFSQSLLRTTTEDDGGYYICTICNNLYDDAHTAACDTHTHTHTHTTGAVNLDLFAVSILADGGWIRFNMSRSLYNVSLIFLLVSWFISQPFTLSFVISLINE